MAVYLKPEDDPGNSAHPCHPISPDKERHSFEQHAEHLTIYIFLVRIKDHLLEEILYSTS
jgi:hypothetical protein